MSKIYVNAQVSSSKQKADLKRDIGNGINFKRSDNNPLFFTASQTLPKEPQLAESEKKGLDRLLIAEKLNVAAIDPGVRTDWLGILHPR
ncbi:5911_t:CDS:2, partial [Gigaspora rosea]